MAYSMILLSAQFAVNNASATNAVVLTLNDDVDLSQYSHKYPVLRYVDKHGSIFNLSNSNTLTTVSSGNRKLNYNIVKVNHSRYPNKYTAMEGYYLAYNPTDNSNNIGIHIDSSGTSTSADFETLKKYAPWAIVPPVI